MKALAAPGPEAVGVAYQGNGFITDGCQALANGYRALGGQLQLGPVQHVAEVGDVIQQLCLGQLGECSHGACRWGGVGCGVSVNNDLRAGHDHDE